MTHRAQIETKSAALSTDFGRDYAMKVFGLTLAELEAIVGRYSKGKRKGQLRYSLQWKTVVRGGWYATGPSFGQGERTQGHVKRPGTRFDHAIVDVWQYDANGGYRTLWTHDHKRFGWIPGETREQYDTRQNLRQHWLKSRQDRAYAKARAIVSKLSDEELVRHVVKRERDGRFVRFSLSFVSILCAAEVAERARAFNERERAELKAWADLERARP